MPGVSQRLGEKADFQIGNLYRVFSWEIKNFLKDFIKISNGKEDRHLRMAVWKIYIFWDCTASVTLVENALTDQTMKVKKWIMIRKFQCIQRIFCSVKGFLNSDMIMPQILLIYNISEWEVLS